MVEDMFENKEPKQHSIIPFLLLIVLAVGAYSFFNYDPTNDAVHVDYSELRKKAVQHFNSANEPATQSAHWVNDNTFSVSVVNNQEKRDGYALYVCEALSKLGLYGKVSKVIVFDVNTINNKPEVLGYHQCK